MSACTQTARAFQFVLVLFGSILLSLRALADQSLDDALCDAADKGNLEGVIDLLQKGASVNAATGHFRFTPLTNAADNDHLEILSYLLEHGANVNQEDLQGSTALLHACSTDHADCALALLKAGADPNIGSTHQRFPLMYAAQKGDDTVVAALLAAKADVGTNCPGQGPAIFWAADGGHVSTLKILLDAGADLHEAVAGPLSSDHMHLTLLGAAACANSPDAIDFLLSRGCDVNTAADDGDTPLMDAASVNATEACEALLLKGADINARNKYGETALMVAIENESRGAFQSLLDHQPNLELKDTEGQTVLMRAAERFDQSFATTLIVDGADVNATDNRGETALTHAGNIGEFAMAKLLQNSGAKRTDLHIIPQDPPPQPLPPAHAWALAVGAMYTQRDDMSHRWLGGHKDSLRSTKEMLQKSWSIRNKADLLKEIDDLRKRGHHATYQKEGMDLMMMTDAQYQKYLADHASRAAEIKALRDSFTVWKDRSGLAWDLCRASMLVNEAYAAHYIAEDEAWTLLMPIARQAQANFSSWKEMSQNYVDGRAIWDKAQDPAMVDCTILLLDPKDPNSPWNYLPWQTDLSGN